MRSALVLVPAMISVLALFDPGLAAAEKPRLATPISGPIVIDAPGAYVLTADFSTDADGIVIRADGVHLDLGGHTITGPGARAGRGVVVEGASGGTIRNGTLRMLGTGVALVGSTGIEVEAIQIDGSDEFADPPAIPPQVGILLVDSPRNEIAGNRISLVNLGIFVRGGGTYENRIHDNTATAGTHGLLGICYNPAEGEGPEGPERDRVQRNVLDGFNGGIQASEGSEQNRFIANVIRYREFAYEDRNGSNRFVGNRTEDLEP